MKKIPPWLRFAIVATTIWILTIYGEVSKHSGSKFSGAYGRSYFGGNGDYFTGLIPLVILWGGGWFLAGFDRVRNFFLRKKHSVVFAICPNEECKQRLRFSTAKGIDTKVTCPKCGTDFINIG